MMNTTDFKQVFKINVITMNHQSIIRFIPFCGCADGFKRNMIMIKNAMLAIIFKIKFNKSAAIPTNSVP